MPSSYPPFRLVDLSFAFEDAGRQNDTRDAELLEEPGTNPAGRENSNHLAVWPDALLVEGEDLLHADDVLFHAGDLRDACNFARTVAHTGSLHHDGEGRGNLLANGFFGQIHIAHGHHGFESGDGVARGVSVNGGRGPFVTGVHGLEHVKGFFATDFTDDDAVGAHTETVDKQLPLLDGALTFNIGRPGFKADDVLLRQPKFGRVFDSNQALVVGNILRQDV